MRFESKCSTINPTVIHRRSRGLEPSRQRVDRHPRNLPPHGTGQSFQAAVEGQLLGLIFFSLLFGFFITKLPEKARSTQLSFWESLNSLILSITNFIISLAPYGVFGLVTPTLMKVGLETLSVMGSFALTVALGLLVHSLVVLPLLLRLFGKITCRSLPGHGSGYPDCLFDRILLGHASLTMECVNKRAGISKK